MMEPKKVQKKSHISEQQILDKGPTDFGQRRRAVFSINGARRAGYPNTRKMNFSLHWPPVQTCAEVDPNIKLNTMQLLEGNGRNAL